MVPPLVLEPRASAYANFVCDTQVKTTLSSSNEKGTCAIKYLWLSFGEPFANACNQFLLYIQISNIVFDT